MEHLFSDLKSAFSKQHLEQDLKSATALLERVAKIISQELAKAEVSAEKWVTLLKSLGALEMLISTNLIQDEEALKNVIAAIQDIESLFHAHYTKLEARTACQNEKS